MSILLSRQSRVLVQGLTGREGTFHTEAMRARVKDVMRYAGPRMTWRHPLLALDHMLSGRRPAPSLEARRP